MQAVKGMNLKRSLVIGASGQVGTQLLEALDKESTGRALPSSRTPREGWFDLDLAEPSVVGQRVKSLNAIDLEAIYCLGSMTNVDSCETAADVALRSNTESPALLAAYAHGRGIPFVYISTEYVFPGTNEHPGPYGETAPTQPVNRYGESKLAGERAVLAAYPGALVLRTTVVYGIDAREKNYLYAVIRNLGAGRVVRVPEDQISTPTYNRDLAVACVGLVGAGARGVLHVCGPEVMSRLKFARQVARHFGLDTSLLKGLATAELEQVAQRPLAAGLDCSTMTESYPQFPMRTLAEGLADCSARMQSFP